MSEDKLLAKHRRSMRRQKEAKKRQFLEEDRVWWVLGDGTRRDPPDDGGDTR